MSIQSYLFAVVFCLSLGLLHAQDDHTLVNLPGVFQSSYTNPAAGVNNGIHIGLPLISSVSIDHTNSFLNPQGLLIRDEQGYRLDSDRLLSQIKDRNTLDLGLAVDLFSIGVPLRNNYFSFAVRERVTANMVIPGDLLRLPLLGTDFIQANGVSIDLSGMNISLDHFTEYGVGWQRSLGDKINFGVRAKFLAGRESIRTSNSDFALDVDPQALSFSVQGALGLQTAGLSAYDDDVEGNTIFEGGSIKDYMLGGKNTGMAIDFGLEYQVGKRWKLAAAMTDMGYINYTHDVRQYGGIGASFSAATMDFTEILSEGPEALTDSLQTVIEGLQSSLDSVFNGEQVREGYRSNLRSKSLFSIGYRVMRRAKSTGQATLNIHSVMSNGNFTQTAVTLNYSHLWTDFIGVTASYRAVGATGKNLGLGLSIRRGPVVWYVSMDNILWLKMEDISLPESQSPINYPAYSQNASAHFGLNFLIGGRSKSKTPKPRLDD